MVPTSKSPRRRLKQRIEHLQHDGLGCLSRVKGRNNKRHQQSTILMQLPLALTRMTMRVSVSVSMRVRARVISSCLVEHHRSRLLHHHPQRPTTAFLILQKGHEGLTLRPPTAHATFPHVLHPQNVRKLVVVIGVPPASPRLTT